MRPPLSVLFFEILLYAALTLDAISLVFTTLRWASDQTADRITDLRPWKQRRAPRDAPA